MHELVIIETGHIDARFKHEVWNMKLLCIFSDIGIDGNHPDVSIINY